MKKKHLLLFLIILYILLQLIFTLFSKGYSIKYKVDDIDITEVKVNNTKGERDNYYFEISYDDTLFGFQSFKNLGRKVIKKIYTFKNSDYKCILPTLKDELFTDMLCLNDDIYYFYQSIKGKDPELDDFVDKLKIYKLDKEEKIDKKDNIVLYKLPYKTNLSVENYKGIYEFTNDIKNYQIFGNDIYQKNISGFINNYYLIADYDESFEFRDFYLINLINNQKTKIVSDTPISMYSFVQGVVDNSLYLIDMRNKKQYKIDVLKKQVILVGNEKRGALVYDFDHFDTKNISEVINKTIKFNLNDIEPGFGNKNYDLVILDGSKKSGYYYLFEKKDIYYKVYRVNVQNNGIITYLFKTDDIESIIYSDYIFYKYKDSIYYIDDYNNSKKIITYNELQYNKTLKFNIYR